MKVYLVKSIKTNFVQVYSSEQYAEAIAIGRNQAHLYKGTDKE